MSRKPRHKGSDRRTYLSFAMKATSHPLRELLLRVLGKKPMTTLELEEISGESRYNLYHHLSVLEQSGLVSHRPGKGRTKEFFVRKGRKPDVAYFVLDSENPEEAAILGQVLDVVEKHLPDKIHKREKIRRGKLLFYYPWSDE